MRIYDELKFKELVAADLDLDKGYLKEDKLLIAHHDATPFIRGKSEQEKIYELESQGITVKTINGKRYKVISSYSNGGEDIEEIHSDLDVLAKEAYDEYEDIYVYVPYTTEELKERVDMRRYAELKIELAKIKEDIEQEIFGLIRDDFDEKKAQAAKIINELRVLEGKEPRAIKE